MSTVAAVSRPNVFVVMINYRNKNDPEGTEKFMLSCVFSDEEDAYRKVFWENFNYLCSVDHDNFVKQPQKLAQTLHELVNKSETWSTKVSYLNALADSHCDLKNYVLFSSDPRAEFDWYYVMEESLVRPDDEQSFRNVPVLWHTKMLKRFFANQKIPFSLQISAPAI